MKLVNVAEPAAEAARLRKSNVVSDALLAQAKAIMDDVAAHGDAAPMLRVNAAGCVERGGTGLMLLDAKPAGVASSLESGREAAAAMSDGAARTRTPRGRGLDPLPGSPSTSRTIVPSGRSECSPLMRR